MDVYCQFCGEPWSFLDVTEFLEDYDGDDQKAFFDGKGCPSCDWGSDLEKRLATERGEVMGMLRDLLGDDIDGIASEMEDWDYLSEGVL